MIKLIDRRKYVIDKNHAHLHWRKKIIWFDVVCSVFTWIFTQLLLLHGLIWRRKCEWAAPSCVLALLLVDQRQHFGVPSLSNMLTSSLHLTRFFQQVSQRWNLRRLLLKSTLERRKLQRSFRMYAGAKCAAARWHTASNTKKLLVVVPVACC